MVPHLDGLDIRIFFTEQSGCHAFDLFGRALVLRTTHDLIVTAAKEEPIVWHTGFPDH